MPWLSRGFYQKVYLLVERPELLQELSHHLEKSLFCLSTPCGTFASLFSKDEESRISLFSSFSTALV